MTPEVLQLIDSAMQGDDETTAQELVVKLHDLGFLMSKRTVLAGHKRLESTLRDLPTASLYEMSISKNVCSGHLHMYE